VSSSGRNGSAWRHVAPAGAPIRALDLIRAAGLALRGSEAGRALQREIARRFGVRHTFLTSTGRAGMTLLMRALGRAAAKPNPKDEVLVPAYTCYSVAASIVKAGLRPRLVDISPETLDFDREQLSSIDCSKVLAIVATNLYGLPNDLPWLSSFAQSRGIFLVDDAAQCMGAVVGGKASGTWGDAGLYSFDKGKNVSAIDGGVVVTNADVIGLAMSEELRQLEAPGLAEAGMSAAKAIAYCAMLRPSLYWIPNRIPQLSLGKTVFTTEFALERPSAGLSALAATMMPQLETFTAARVGNAAALLTAMRPLSGIETIAPVHGSTPVYLRLPILIHDENARAHAIARLNAAGIGATASYPESLADVPELRQYLAGGPTRVPGARYIAKRIVTLPTHSFVNAEDVSRAAEALGAALERPGADGLAQAGGRAARA